MSCRHPSPQLGQLPPLGEIGILAVYISGGYDEVVNTITFVKGHDWEFDGKTARKSVGERWPEETREWAGSNFMKMPMWMDVQFVNNPFNYTHRRAVRHKPQFQDLDGLRRAGAE